MRRKLCLGLTLAIIAIVVGVFIVNQTIGAQDPPKKAEPEQKKNEPDLFDALRQKFEAKPDAVTPPLPLPTAQAGVGSLPPLPTAQSQAPTPTPLPPPNSAPMVQVPGPTVDPKPLKEGKAPLPIQQPLPIPGGLTLPGEAVPGVPNLPGSKGTAGSPLPPTPVQPQQPSPAESFPPLPPKGHTAGNLPKAKGGNEQMVPGGETVPPQRTHVQEPINLKGSAWTLHVEMVNGQTVVTATVNKKHEFKIVCQHIDLQTAAGVMRAKGKVQISGDALNGSCDQLTLPLHDDRLVLEGAAEVRIQKTSGNVSATRSAAFELKGDKLDLRISELRTSAYIETSWSKVSGDVSEVRTVPTSMRPGDSAKAWTSYGTLRNVKSHDANVWSLVGSEGQVIAYVMARDGGSLEHYVGRTIAVYGAREGERAGSPLVRVTHIAVP
jgi:hypothetical protein